jgi:hypothetical protein
MECSGRSWEKIAEEAMVATDRKGNYTKSTLLSAGPRRADSSMYPGHLPTGDCRRYGALTGSRSAPARCPNGHGAELPDWAMAHQACSAILLVRGPFAVASIIDLLARGRERRNTEP